MASKTTMAKLMKLSATRPARGEAVSRVEATSGPCKGLGKSEAVSYLLTRNLAASIEGGEQQTDEAIAKELQSWYPPGTKFQSVGSYRSYYNGWGTKGYKSIGPCLMKPIKGQKGKRVVALSPKVTPLLDDIAKQHGCKDGLELCAVVFANWSEYANILSSHAYDPVVESEG